MQNTDNPDPKQTRNIIDRLPPRQRAAVLNAEAILHERLAAIERDAQPFTPSRIVTRRMISEAIADWAGVTFDNLILGLIETTESKEGIISEAKEHLLGHCPDEKSRETVERTLTVRLARIAAWAAEQEAGQKHKAPSPSAGEGPERSRKEEVNMFLQLVERTTGRGATKEDFFTVAGYTNKTEFYKWQRGDPECSGAARENFERVLNMLPADFIEALDRKRDQQS